MTGRIPMRLRQVPERQAKRALMLSFAIRSHDCPSPAQTDQRRQRCRGPQFWSNLPTLPIPGPGGKAAQREATRAAPNCCHRNNSCTPSRPTAWRAISVKVRHRLGGMLGALGRGSRCAARRCIHSACRRDPTRRRLPSLRATLRPSARSLYPAAPRRPPRHQQQGGGTGQVSARWVG